MSTRGGLRNEELLTFIMQFYRRLALQYLIYLADGDQYEVVDRMKIPHSSNGICLV